jgi:hypothetical protein
MSQQRPTSPNNLTEWGLYRNKPREKRVLVVSEFETIYGEAPSGAHESEKRWSIWRELTDENGRTEIEYAQDGANDLRWIYASLVFNPQPNGVYPYFIELDNYIVFDGMVAGLPIANITVYDADSTTHEITVSDDPANKFEVIGSVLYLKNAVQLIDVAYPLKLKAKDEDGNEYVQPIAIYVQDPAPPVAGDFVGELNIYEEDSAMPTLTTTLIDYTIPASRKVRMRDIEAFGMNKANFTIEINGDVVARKETYYTRYETLFNFENYSLKSGDNIKVIAQNKGTNTGLFNARMRGYQYAI